MDDASPLTDARPPVKKTLFRNRPAWSKAAPTSQPMQDGLDMFSRSAHTIAQIEEEKRRQQEKKTKKQLKREEEITDRKAKRRRFSLPRSDSSSDDEDASASEDVKKERTAYKKRSRSPTAEKSKLPTPNSPPTNDTKVHSPRKTHNELVIIDLDTDEDDAGPPPPHTPPEYADDVRGQSIDDQGDLNRGVTSNVGHSGISTMPKDPLQISEPILGPSRSPSITPKPGMHRAAPITQQPSLPDPILKILIWSKLENTNPLIVQRKLSQRLGQVRRAWCDKQGFDDAKQATVFLTWRSRRVFDPTTCKSLGVSVDEHGEVFIKGKDQPPGPENAQIEMQAMTQELFDKDKREMEMAKQKKVNPAGADREGDMTQVKEVIAVIHVTLKAKGYQDYKLLVKPTTKFGKIVSAFRKVREPPPGSTVFLMFDGEKLDDEDEVQTSDVSDMDNIDVYVK